MSLIKYLQRQRLITNISSVLQTPDCVFFLLYLANIFQGPIEYELIYSLRGAKH